MGYLDYAGLQYLWSKLKEKFAPKSHSHDDRYYTESEMDGKLNSKVNNNEAGANGLINKLSTADGIPNDATVFISQHNDGKTASYYRRPISTLWTYIKSKADSVYQPKGSYAASSHTHDDRYYTETEINSKLNGKAVNITLSKVDLNTVKTPGFYNAGGGNGCTNVPVSDAFGLIVTHNANGEYYTQIFFLVDKNTSYRRYCNGGTWSGWTQDKYTDTNTWRGIQNNLTSDSTSDSLSAAQGKALKALVDGKLDKNEKAVDSAKLGGFHLNDIKKYFNGVPSIRNDGVMEVGKYIDFHTTSDDTSDYAARITAEKTGLTISGTTKGTFSGSLSGNASTATSATTASKLSTSAGSATQPVYFKDGVPVATTYTLNKTVPADAKFTDTNTWRGIQNNLTSDSADQSLSAAQGKVLKGMVDEKLGKNDKATSAATADKAAKLTTARTVSGGSDITLSFNYDGSGNSTANIGFYSCKHNVDNTNNYPFHRFARLDVNKGAWVNKSITFLISQDFSGGGYGICRLVYRSNADSGNASVDAQWLVRRGFSADTIQVAIKTDKTNGAYCDAFYKSSGTYMGVVIRAIASGGRATSGRTWTLVDSNEVGGTTATDKKTSSECWKTIADAGTALHKQAYSASAPAKDEGYVASAGSANTSSSCAGNSASATKLTSSAGSATQPVYFKDGKPVVIGYTIAKSVPADAKFTDTNTWRGIQDNLTSNSKDQSLSAAQGKALKTLVDGKAAVGHTHNSVKDAGDNSSNTTFAYSKSGMNYGDYSWLAGWNGYELRAINKNQFATAGHNHDSRYYTESEIDSKLDGKSNVGHTHDYLPTAGGTMNGDITFSDSSHGKIYSGPTNNVNGPGGDLNNIVIESWNGLSFTTGCPNQTYTGKTAVGIDCREGVVKAARFDGTLTGTAATLGGGGNPYAPMTFNWSGQDGQPTWLWGGNDASNMYVWNPSNFSVNYANSAGSATIAWNGVETSGSNYIRFKCGVQICWKANVAIDAYGSTYTFQAAFSAIPAITAIGCQDLDDVFFIRNITKTNFIGDKKGYLNGNVSWIAVGVWK